MARERAVAEKKWPILLGVGAIVAIPFAIWLLRRLAPPPPPEEEAQILAFIVSKA